MVSGGCIRSPEDCTSVRRGVQPRKREGTMSEKCLVHDETMVYDERSGFEICHICERERPSQPPSQQPDPYAELREKLKGAKHSQYTSWKDGIDIEVCQVDCAKC